MKSSRKQLFRLQDWLNNLPIHDPIERSMAFLLQAALIGLLVMVVLGTAVYITIANLSVQEKLNVVANDMVGFVVAAIPLVLLRRGYYRGSVLVIIVILITTPALAVTTSYDLSNSGGILFQFTLAIILAGLLVSRRTLIHAFVSSAMVVGFSAFRGQSAAPQLAAANVVIAISFILYNGVIAFIIDRFGITLRTALTDSLERGRELQSDIIRRKQAEDDLRIAEENYYNIFENSLDGIFQSLPAGRFITVNPALARLWGYDSPEDLVASVTDIATQVYTNPEVRAEHIHLLKEQGGNLTGFEYQAYRKDGSVIWVSENVHSVHRADGALLYYEGTVEDISNRKQAEESLAASEAELRALFASMLDVVLVIDREGVCRKVAPTNPGLLVRPPNELLGKNLWDVFPDEQARDFIDSIQQVLETRQTTRIEYALQIGERMIWFSTFISFMDKDNTLWVARDVSQHKQAEAEREKYFKFFQSSTDMMCIADPNGAFIKINPACVQLLGYSEAELISRPFIEFVHPDDKQSTLDEMERQQKISYSLNFENRYVCKDGSIVWLSWRANYDKSEGLTYATARDITERKRIESILQARLRFSQFADSHSLDELLQKTLDEAEVLTGSQIGFSHFLEADQKTLRLQMWSTNTIQNMCTAEGKEQHYSIDEAGVWVDCVSTRAPVIYNDYASLPHRKGLPDGHAPVHRILVVPVMRENRIMMIIGVGNKENNYDEIDVKTVSDLADSAWDIVQRKRAEELIHQYASELKIRVEERTAELVHANRAKDEFLANMSHELRTPLNGILGFSETLMEGVRGPLTEKQKQAVGFIYSSGEHLLELINDILDVSKIEAGKFELHPENVEVNDICESSLNFIKQLAHKKSITVEYSPSPTASKIFADRVRLKQILVNLLNNAVKFTPEKGKIKLKVQADATASQMRFSIIDNGIGITPEDLQKLFKPFVQVDSSLSRQYEGTGLGLVLSKKMVEMHGGSIKVQSTVGAGSRFTFILPWDLTTDTENNPASSDAGHKEPDAAATGRGKIMIADDNEANVMMVQDYLESLGYQILVAHDGEEALLKAQEFFPDLILMDIQMPKVNGFEATYRLRADPRFASVPIIALTAFAMPGDRERCLEAGMEEYLSKPVRLKELTQMIENFLERSKKE